MSNYYRFEYILWIDKLEEVTSSDSIRLKVKVNGSALNHVQVSHSVMYNIRHTWRKAIVRIFHNVYKECNELLRLTYTVMQHKNTPNVQYNT